MNFARVFIVLVAFFVAVFALESRVFLERASPLPIAKGWTRVGPVSQSNRATQLTFAVKQRNLDQLESLFWAVSNPTDAKYGQHLTLEQIKDLVGPEQSTVDLLVNWLDLNGFENIQVTHAREFVTATAPLSVVSRVFNVQYNFYRHSTGMITEASLGPYTVPENIGTIVDFITGIVGFPDIQKPSREYAESVEADSQDITPEVIRARYNISANTLCSNPRNSYAVAEFQAQYYSPTDLATFWAKYVPFAPAQTVYKVVGTNNPSRPGVEASLDIEYLMGVAPGCDAYFYSQASFNFYNDLVNWVQLLANDTNPPYVHSVSYGSQGNYPSDSYIFRMNSEFQKLGVRGLSILFASGDSGAGCEGKRTENTLVDEATCDCEFYPSFPATCQYITSVGATRFINGNSGPEAAVYLFKSGGGFSQDLSIPNYQANAVSHYFTTEATLPEACAYNASGRGTPDVAALGDEHFKVVNGGRTISVGGTSASCPTFAAIVTLLNDIRLTKGQSTLGFLNPFLYQTASAHPDAFYDITIGDNTNSLCCKSGALSGFDCASGWDPVTGLGTPDFSVLKNLV